jgi:hypothetical protein
VSAAAYAGIIVDDVDATCGWCETVLGCRSVDGGGDWACLEFPNGSRIELFAGRSRHPGLVFPSYGAEPGPAVLPGYTVEDPVALAETLDVARSLPDWQVVVTPDRSRLVLTDRHLGEGAGLVAFRWSSPAAAAQRTYLERLGIPAEVASAEVCRITPVVSGSADRELTAPGGVRFALVRRLPSGSG